MSLKDMCHTYATCLSAFTRSRFVPNFTVTKYQVEQSFGGRWVFWTHWKNWLSKNVFFCISFLQNSSLKPQIYFKLIKRALKWILHPKFSMSWYIAHVFHLFGSKVTVLAFLMAAILGICKIDAFHPQETWGTFWKAWMGYFELSCQFWSVSSFIPTFMIILTNITPLVGTLMKQKLNSQGPFSKFLTL